MKNHLTTQFACAALAVGILGFAAVASAQQGGAKNTSKADPTAATPTPRPNSNEPPPIVDPAAGRVGNMAATGAKPSKAELAKRAAEKSAASGGKPAAAGKPAAMAALDAQDSSFMMEAARANASEVAMGKMAEKKGKSAEVKNFGKMMVADHSAANNELMALAKAKGVKLNTSPKMEKMNEADFDNAYLAEMVKNHQKDVALFQQAAKSSKDPQVKAWAAKMLPTLKKHLKAAQAAQKKMAKAG